MIEIKSRRQKYQIETIVSGEMPADYLMQVQTALLVTDRAWCDFVTYSGGLPMLTLRVFPDAKVHDAIIAAALAFEERIAIRLDQYHAALGSLRTIPTERRVEQEMF